MEDRTQQSCFYLISFKNSPHFPHEVIGEKQIERYGTKPQTLPSKQKLFILQQIHPTRRIDGTIDTMPTQNKISAHVSLTITSIPSEMNNLCFRAKVFTE